MATLAYIPDWLAPRLLDLGYTRAEIQIIDRAITRVDRDTRRGPWSLDKVAAASGALRQHVCRLRGKMEHRGHLVCVTRGTRGNPGIYDWREIIMSEGDEREVARFQRHWLVHYGRRRVAESRERTRRQWMAEPPDEGFFAFLKSKDGQGEVSLWLRSYRDTLPGREDVAGEMRDQGGNVIQPIRYRAGNPLFREIHTPDQTIQESDEVGWRQSNPGEAPPKTAPGNPTSTPLKVPKEDPQSHTPPAAVSPDVIARLTAIHDAWMAYQPLHPRSGQPLRPRLDTLLAECAAHPEVDLDQLESSVSARLDAFDHDTHDPDRQRHLGTPANFVTSGRWRDYLDLATPSLPPPPAPHPES